MEFKRKLKTSEEEKKRRKKKVDRKGAEEKRMGRGKRGRKKSRK
jgi:hypothetical protein